MPFFVCDKCGCIDNTVFGKYWDRNDPPFHPDPELKGKALCFECFYGKWHGRFPKMAWKPGCGKIVKNREDI